jgi:hypothetical protein
MAAGIDKNKKAQYLHRWLYIDHWAFYTNQPLLKGGSTGWLMRYLELDAHTC